ncbi:hypothetical protein ACJZ2D_009785 [Fusarium nematophilum]
MEDAVRPDEESARAMYARAYRTWSNLSERASEDPQLLIDCLHRLPSAFPHHPCFPQNPNIHNSLTNVALVKGNTTWLPAQDPDHLPPFQDEVMFHVAWDQQTPITLTSDVRRSTTTLPGIFDNNNNHVAILFLAWAYILSARWAELIPGACMSQRSSAQPSGDTGGSRMPESDEASILVNVGKVSEDAAHWWHTILSAEGGWDATIHNTKGLLLHSPWSTRLSSEQSLVVLAKGNTAISKGTLPSSTTAYRFLCEYCSLHEVQDQSLAALAAVLLIPVAKYDRSRIELPMPRMSCGGNIGGRSHTASQFTTEGQLDRLLTMSCNPRGLKALLNSIFFEPDVASNICGMWLQGSLAFLDAMKNPSALLQTLTQRDPELGALWIGAFVTGTHTRCLRAARGAWWPVDLSAAAWTGTLVSFIQVPVSILAPRIREISRADECRLLYISHGINYTTPPLFPFAPFGSTALDDTTLDVHEHALCGREHGLRYAHFTWTCNDGTEVKQGKDGGDAETIRQKNGHLSSHDDDDDGLVVDYDEYDSEDENSEVVTRNIFTWLRGEDGFPVAERAIREHEWIDNLDSDDDAPIEGDVCSTAGGDLRGWLMKTSTQRSNSI